MSAWKDTLTCPPPANQLIWFRRWPEDTPPLQGVWSPENGGALLCEGQWFIPADLCIRWRVPPYTIPLPAAGSPLGWRDPILYPPQPGQSCWVRRFLGNTAAFPAVWDQAAHAFILTVRDEYTLAIEWYYVWRWKPR